MEKDYGKPVDIWAAGVVLAELLFMIEDNCPVVENRQSLFPGKYCFPLSPRPNVALDEEGIPLSMKGDQLELIFDLIGSPDERDVSFVTDEKARLYLSKFKTRRPADLSKKFPSCDPEGLKLITEMLQFNPFFRPSIESILKHPYFSKVTRFGTVQPAKEQIRLAFEASSKVSVAELRALIVNEVKSFHSQPATLKLVKTTEPAAKS